MSQPLRRSPRLNPGLQDEDMPHIITYKRHYQEPENTYLNDLINPILIAIVILDFAILVSVMLWPNETIAALKETLNNFGQF